MKGVSREIIPPYSSAATAEQEHIQNALTPVIYFALSCCHGGSLTETRDGINTERRAHRDFLPSEKPPPPPPKIWFTCQCFMMALMTISLNLEIIIKLMFKVNAQNFII